MNHEIPDQLTEIVVIELDGEHSDPITPLKPDHIARLEKIREMYVKAGIIPKPTGSEKPPQTTQQ